MSNNSKKGLFSKIENREDAVKVAKSASTIFFVLAGIQMVAVPIVLNSFPISLIIDTTTLLVCGLLIRKIYSRIAALIVLLHSLVAIGTTIANNFGANLGGGGGNILAVAILLWSAVRGVESTFKLHGCFAPAKGDHPPI